MGLTRRLTAAAACGLLAVPLLAGAASAAESPQDYDPNQDPGSAWSVAAVTGARSLWAKGVTGDGVDVALLDSGVTRVPGLDAPGKVVDGPDLSFESQSAGTRHLDTFGHGTFMAGLIAGEDVAKNRGKAKDPSVFHGLAPDARLLSVKVADAYGASDVSQVVAGIDWVVQHRRDAGLDVRVLNLSFGLPSTQSARLDPLAHAVEQAWRAGIVVVVSAGNDGTGTGRLLNPAQDPYVLAVGAENSQGTSTLADDVIAPFSSHGDGVRNPDLVAPGQSLQSLRVPGSWIDVQHPSARLGERYFRGSGTSQAAAVVSGAAALLLSQRPELTPDQVKDLLVRGARTLDRADPQAQGAGLVQVDRSAKLAAAAAAQSFPRSTGTGSLEAARGGQHLTLDGVELTGERDVFGRPFDSAAHAALAERGAAWDGGTWNGSVWTGSGWDGGSWADAAWTGTAWSGRAWAGRGWATGSWTGRAWAGGSWADSGSSSAGSLTGRAWAGRAWADGGWE